MVDLALKALLDKKEILKIFSTSVASTISQFTHIAASGNEPSHQTTELLKTSDVAAAIRFQSNTLNTELFIGFSKSIYLKLYEGTTGSTTEDLESGCQDLAGEILNIAFGNIDPQLRGLGIQCKSSFPKSYLGNSLKAAIRNLPPKCILIPISIQKTQCYLAVFANGTFKESWQYTPVK